MIQTDRIKPNPIRKIMFFLVAFGLVAFNVSCAGLEDEPEMYSLTFKANFSGGEDQTFNISPTQHIIDFVPTIDREGYLISGWFDNQVGSGTARNLRSTINNDLTLYAKWEPISFSVELVTSIPGEGITSVSVPYGAYLADYLPVVNRYGYEFIAWFDDSLLTQPVNAAETKNVSMTLYAGWKDVNTEYYVSTVGNDDHEGSSAQPFSTFEKAVSVMTPGDTMIVYGGTYNEQLVIDKSGTEDAWLCFAAYPGAEVVIDGTGIMTSWDGLWYGMILVLEQSYISINGFKVINASGSAIFVGDSHHIDILNNHTINSQNPGIFAWGVDDLLIDGNEVEMACMHPESGLEDISLRGNKRVIVRNNHVHDSDNIAIDAAGGVENARIYDNLVEYTGLGIYVDSWDGDLSDVHIYNNISRYNNVGLCVNTENGGSVENVLVYNNQIYGNTDDGMVVGWGGVPGRSLSISEVHFYANKVYDNLGDGIVIYGREHADIDSIFVYNNYVYDNQGAGIAISGLSDISPFSLNEIWIINNTIVNNGSEDTWFSGGIAIGSQANAIGTMSNIHIQNNIVSDNFTFSIAIWPWGRQPETITISHNLIDGYRNAADCGERKGIDFIEASPGFVDPDNHDFRLLPSSLAIDAGFGIGMIRFDHDSDPRPFDDVDIGADEYVGE